MRCLADFVLDSDLCLVDPNNPQLADFPAIKLNAIVVPPVLSRRSSMNDAGSRKKTDSRLMARTQYEKLPSSEQQVSVCNTTRIIS